MTGGLLNLISNNGSDLYLTGMPQITFYKMVYRRYTHFACESVYCNFNDNIEFNKEVELIPQRVGDLIYKTYLHITIPEISITYNDVGIDAIQTNLTFDYNKIKIYMKIQTDIYRIVYRSVNIYNVSYSDVLNECVEYNENNNVYDLLSEYDILLSEHKFNKCSNLWNILNNLNVNILIAIAQNIINTQIYTPNTDQYNKEIQRLIKVFVLNELTKSLEKCKEIQKYFNTENIKYINKTNNIKCAWVKNLGHSIIEYIDVVIGGNRIDRHWGVWINVWYQLTYKAEQINAYNEIIGNVAQLTEFNNNVKPKYDLYIPLSFWFNKFNGNSFPLIALQHTDFHIFVKLRKFDEVFYIEKIYSGVSNDTNVVMTADMITNNITNITEIKDIDITSIWNSKGKQLYGHMMIDYIYLNPEERKKYAQSGHEYLIENIQTNKFDVNNNIFDARLDFVNPSKEIIWVLTKECNITNPYSYTECKWYDHSLNYNNPLINASITFNSYVRVATQPGIYFNKYQPYTFHKITPDDGINMYSFSLEPLQHQPTGTCNFSRLNDVKLLLNIDNKYFRYTEGDIYNYDNNLDFDIIIDPQELIDKIDIDYAKENMKQETINAYEQLLLNNNVIKLSTYNKLILKTKVECIVFNVSINILRLIGGYGALAYTGNS